MRFEIVTDITKDNLGKLAKIQDLYDKVLQESYGKLLKNDEAKKDAGIENLDSFCQAAAKNTVEDIKKGVDKAIILTDDQGSIFGFVAFRAEEDKLYISQAGVATEFQRKGIAGFLIGKVIEYCTKDDKDKKLKSVVVLARNFNDPANELYKKIGMEDGNSEMTQSFGYRSDRYISFCQKIDLVQKTIDAIKKFSLPNIKKELDLPSGSTYCLDVGQIGRKENIRST